MEKKAINDDDDNTSKMVGTTLKTMDERIKFIARLPRSIVLLKAPVSRLQIK